MVAMGCKRSRSARVLVTIAFLCVQLPVTVLEIPKLGFSRYCEEVRSGIRRAMKEALA